jgi:hypothetical protein
MNSEERQLITGLFDRMRGFALAEKDGEAEALISAQMASVRDAPYMLVQSVLVQEHALQQAEGRIRELEEQVRALQSAAEQRPAGSGSFLGGLFGGRPGPEAPGAPGAEPARGPTSVPVIGSRATPSVYEGRPGGAPQQGLGQQVPPGQAQQPQAQPPGGGFLRSAMATAAGVAGGMLAASAISSLLTGHSAHANPASATQQTPDSATPASAGETAQPQEAQPQDAAAGSDAWQEPAYQEAADSDGGWFGDDGGDFDI